MQWLVLAVAVCLATAAHAQSVDSPSRERAVPFYVRLFVPSVASDSYALRNYIAHEDLSDSVTARDAMDDIYLDAIELTHGNVGDALLVSTIGTLEHESIPLHLLGGTLSIPLSTESHASFELRVQHLPRHVYSVAEDDRDKLQHVFASAWVKKATGMTWLARLAGYLVEAGENAFKIEGAEDLRDLHADDDGIRFGTVARATTNVLPSQFLSPNP